MLNSLHIKNLALIDEQDITFEDGLNILTGETGAGKSIVIGSINLALGEQAKGSLIREGTDYALITLVFGDLSDETAAAIRAMDLPVEEDNSVILERRITPNKSTAKVCGEVVSLKQLRALSQLLIQIHGQNDHQLLLQKTEQARILDAYGGAALNEELTQVKSAYEAYEESVKRLKACEIDEGTRKREEDLAAYELKEITDAALQAGEDERLEETFRRMSNAEKISEALQTAHALTEGDGEAESAASLLGRALKELRTVAQFDTAIEGIASQLADADAILQEAGRDVMRLLNDASFDAFSFQEVSDRLNRINRLKDKYGGSVEAVLSYAEQKETELQRLQDLDTERERARAEKEKTHRELIAHCERLSALRLEQGEKLAEQMRTVLSDLNFLDNGFEVMVEGGEEHLSATGFDEITFLISLNPGEPLKPLHEIASGGELSRIMLALKTVMADEDGLMTMIFDEIDAGISGVTAWKVAERLAALARNKQVICITHLAQIAAMQDVHFMIDKQVSEEGGSVRTLTKVQRITEEESVLELARLLGGVGASGTEAEKTAQENALHLRQEALRLKAH